MAISIYSESGDSTRRPIIAFRFVHGLFPAPGRFWQTMHLVLSHCQRRSARYCDTRLTKKAFTSLLTDMLQWTGRCRLPRVYRRWGDCGRLPMVENVEPVATVSRSSWTWVLQDHRKFDSEPWNLFRACGIPMAIDHEIYATICLKTHKQKSCRLDAFTGQCDHSKTPPISSKDPPRPPRI